MHNSVNRLKPYVFRFVPAFVACLQPSLGEGETKEQLSDSSKKEKISKKIKPKKMLKNILHHRNEDKKIKSSTIKDHPAQDQENNPMKETSVKYGKFLSAFLSASKTIVHIHLWRFMVTVVNVCMFLTAQSTRLISASSKNS